MELLSGLNDFVLGAKYAQFKNVGDVVGGTIVGAEERQATEYPSKAPKFWPDGNKMMEWVVTLRQKDGSEVKVPLDTAAKKEAVRDAIRASCAPGLALGGKLVLKHSGTEPSKAGAPKKLYEAVYAAPVVSVD